MTASSKSLAFEWAQGFRDGHTRGYIAGVDDGENLGFFDVKRRMYEAFKDDSDALKVIEAVIGPPVFE